MDSFVDNKIKDENIFNDEEINENTDTSEETDLTEEIEAFNLEEASDETDEDLFDAEDPEESFAVSEMVKNIASGENKSKKSEDDKDEEEWVVSESNFFTKLAASIGAAVSKLKNLKNKKKEKDNVKKSDESSDDEEAITIIESLSENGSKSAMDRFETVGAQNGETPVYDDEEDEKPDIASEFVESFNEEAENREDQPDEMKAEAPEAVIEVKIPEEEIPADEVPADETLADESPAEETPAEEMPAEEAPEEEYSIEDYVAEKEKQAAEAAIKAEADEKRREEIKEMRFAVEDRMFIGETDEEKEARHKRAAEIAELPVIDLSDLDLFGDEEVSENENPEAVINDIDEHLAQVVNIELEKKKRKWPKVVAAVFGVIIFLGLFLTCTTPGQKVTSRIIARIIFSKINTVDNEPGNTPGGDVVAKLTGTPTPKATATPATTSTPNETPVLTPTPEPTPVEYTGPQFKKDDSVINILLIGVENHANQLNGRSDSMMIGSFDKDGGEIKLVSLMRDLYVKIPGQEEDDRLNAAYAFGGAPLLMETLKLNFGLECDGYVIVNYEGFESIIDYVGGVEIDLTKAEADYLNSTNYISDKSQRNVVEGTQVLTGNQALGYCRVREIETSNGLGTDFGRTYRQRVVLGKVFNKYKSANITTLFKALMDCLKFVTCPAGLETIAADCMQIAIEKQMFDLGTYRVPFSGQYEEKKISGKWVLVWNEENIYKLHEILYGTRE